ncbi:type ISP restriction/modification enzyme [Gulosibacter bifidus]|uniref:Type ISP restriction/modification enzyme n=1 Tax=Gulosibacter bifidus TaxID=272239 RepID=A0ABW5RHC0_9MICO|nr:type ISP restriction/modification enzyme [Gulosibacter bifidus]
MVSFSPADSTTPVAATSQTDFDKLLDEYRALSDSKRMQGNYFEELTAHFLRLDLTWGGRYTNVWLWKDWPGRAGLPDTGADLIAEDAAGKITAIQCKFYAANKKVSKGDLDSFLEFVGRQGIDEGLWFDTSELEWSANAIEAIKNRTTPVRRITIDQFRHSNIDWSTYSLLHPENAPQTFTRKRLRPHQHEAIEAVMDAFNSGVERGKLVMACGTGKTFTALKLAERVTRDLANGHSTMLFLVPSIALLNQTLVDWSQEHDPELPFTALAVCSDPSVGRKQTGDITSVPLEQLPIPATTDPARISAEYDTWQEHGEGMLVVFSTYQSIDVISQAQRNGALPSFDLVICDEAHRTTGVTLASEDESAFVRVHDNEFIDAARRVYMTATPRIYNDKVKNKAKEQDAVLASMDDETLFGKVLYRISFGEAVESQLLTDYKVLVLGVSEDQVAGSFQKQMANHNHELTLPDVSKLVGCWNGLAKRESGKYAEGFGDDIAPMRRAVAFAKDIKASKQIASEFPALVHEHLQNVVNDDPTDDLAVQAMHVDGTMSSAERERMLDWLKEPPAETLSGAPVARVLTNARCLSEGVDVPSLDAVLFLSARKSQVDVVQAVGRVMRRAEGKQCGYIILPIAIPASDSAHDALSHNKNYEVVWQVLQALRAHDERLDAAINQMAISGKAPETIMVKTIDLAKKQRAPRRPGIGDDEFDPADRDEQTNDTAVALFGADFEAEWKDHIYAKLVEKVGDRLYWDDWARDIEVIAGRCITLIRAHLEGTRGAKGPFREFVRALGQTVNPEITDDEAIEMLAQHMITRPIFDAMFPEREFSAENPVSLKLNRVLDSFSENQAFENELEQLGAFYASITERIRNLPDVRSKQSLLVLLYDRFFSKAFPKLADRMGIVFTPVEVVDYILRSADVMCQAVFGKSLSDEGVNILDPFVGTGTFITRLLQLGLIKPQDLARKFQHELFANEIVLLSYYIAAVNIESVYREVCADAGLAEDAIVASTAAGFPGISLTDTFAMTERESEVAMGFFPENTERIETQLDSAINVIVMNPPYSVGQSSANDDNQNAKYPVLDAEIRNSYALRSTGGRKSQLYDSYFRAIKWATLRVKERGIIAFVSNNGFIDGNTADGVRLTWTEEFDEIFVFNLRGNQRTQGELSRKEGGKVFGSGSRTGVAITVLVKNGEGTPAGRVHYHDIGDYLDRETKLTALQVQSSIEGTEFVRITPNDAGDWINQRDERFPSFTPLINRAGDGFEQSLFRLSSLGLATNRDAWCYNFSRHAISTSVNRTIDTFNSCLADQQKILDPTRIAWSGTLDTRLRKQLPLDSRTGEIVTAAYRPFLAMHCYWDAALNHRQYRLPKLWPTAAQTNRAFCVNQRGGSAPLMTVMLPDLHLNGDSQVFARYIWEPVDAEDGGFNLDSLTASAEEVIVDGYRRVDNITDDALAMFQRVYDDATITKDDIFYYVYAVLHHPEYRERYAADLKKMLPRIPNLRGFHDYARIGRELTDLHVNYERVPAHPDIELQLAANTPSDEYDLFAIGTKKMSWTKRTSKTALRYNEYVTITGIPEAAENYEIGGRSPLGWIIDRYYIKTDKASGIVNDPNAWLREQQNPRYVVDLIASLVTLSLETQRLVAELPEFDVID